MFALLVIPMLLLAGVVVYALRPVLSRIPPVLKHCRKRSRNLPRKAFDLPPRRGGYGSATVLSVHSAVVAVLGVAAVVSLGAGWAGLGRLKNSATVGHAITRVLLAVATVPVPTVVFVLAALSALRGNGAVPRFLTRGVTHKTLLVVVPAVVALIVVSSAHAFCHIAVGALLAVLGPVLGTLCFIQQPKSHTTSNTSWTDVSESHITAPPRATPRTPERRSERNRLRSSLYSTDSWISSPSQSIASLPEWDFTVPDESSTEPSVGSITTHAVATLNSTARGTPKPMPVASAYVLSSNNKRFSYRRMSCMRKTSSPQWTFSSSAEILADSEWESVSALDGSESWAGGSNVVGGLVAMICVVLCYGLQVPLLAVGPHPATVGVFVASLCIPAVALALVVFLVDHPPKAKSNEVPDAQPVQEEPTIYTVAKTELLKPTPIILARPSLPPGISVSEVDTTMSCDDHPLSAQIQVATRGRRSPSPSYILESSRMTSNGDSFCVDSYRAAGDSLDVSTGHGQVTYPFKLSTSTVDFSQAVASTPLRQTNADLSVDWDAFDLPPVPSVPAKYSHGPVIASSSPSHRVDAQESTEMDVSIANNAALARMLFETPRKAPSPQSTPGSLNSFATMTSFATRVAKFGKSSLTTPSTSTPGSLQVPPIPTPPVPPTHPLDSFVSKPPTLLPLRLVQQQRKAKPSPVVAETIDVSSPVLCAKVVRKKASRESVKTSIGVSKSRAGSGKVLAPLSTNTLSSNSQSWTYRHSKVKGSSLSQASLGGLGLGLNPANNVSVTELRKLGLPVPSRSSVGAKMSVDKENV